MDNLVSEQLVKFVESHPRPVNPPAPPPESNEAKTSVADLLRFLKG